MNAPTTPIDYRDAMTLSEEACANVLCKELGFTLGKDAHIGWNPGKPDCLVFTLTELRNGDMAHDDEVRDYHFSAQCAIWRRERALVQRHVMESLRLAPRAKELFRDTNVFLFRIATNGVSRITVEDMEVKDGEKIPCNMVTLTFDIGFRAV